MTPLEFLKEEFDNTQRALDETLRHDYAPRWRDEYYPECAGRLFLLKKRIELLTAGNADGITSTAKELASVSQAVALIERSRLGEFSWPFADELRAAATSLLTEKGTADGEPIEPIVHVVSEPAGYRIKTEGRLLFGRKRFVTIHFPRQLKYHVLLHALFGHELGHAALHIPEETDCLKSVVTTLRKAAPLQSAKAMNDWVHGKDAPKELTDQLTRHAMSTGRKFEFGQDTHEGWLHEFVCDLFGLACFGPAFAAAHRAYLAKPYPYQLNLKTPTHPPYAFRHKMLVQAMRVMHWDRPTTAPSGGQFYAAEKIFLDYLTEDSTVEWAKIFDDSLIDHALNAIVELFKDHPKLAYQQIEAKVLADLLTNLSDGVPPVLAPIDEDGVPHPVKLSLGKILYAGWVHWIGRTALKRDVSLDFFRTNRLCDQALIQQAAINRVLSAKPRELQWGS